jgi:hypothetical protein
VTNEAKRNEDTVGPLVRPTRQGYWWWLPKCFLDEGKTDGRYWSVMLEGPQTDKVGLFVGPLVPPSLPNAAREGSRRESEA